MFLGEWVSGDWDRLWRFVVCRDSELGVFGLWGRVTFHVVRGDFRLGVESSWRFELSFLFEKLDVYSRALDLIEDLDVIIESIKGRFPASRLDQLTRASMSIPLNIAEGSGRHRPLERGRFFVIARGSAFECVAVLQILHRKKLISEIEYTKRYGDIQRVAKMLSGLISHTDKKALEKGFK